MDFYQRISTDGSDRGTAYTVSGKILRRRGAVLFTWLDAPDDSGKGSRAMLGACDAASGALRPSYPIGNALDNHCGPTIAMDGQERVHAVIGGHHTPFLYRWADDPENPGAWSDPEPLGPADTYPSLVADRDGTLHLVCREQMGGYMTPWQMWYRRKRPGAPWEAPVPLAVSPVPGYNHFMQSLSAGPSGALHLTFQFHYSDTGKSGDGWGRAAVCLRSDDGGDTWLNEDRRLAGPLTVDAMRPVGGQDSLPRKNGLSISNHVTDEQDRPWFFSSHPEYPSGILWHRGTGGWRPTNMEKALKGLTVSHGGATSISRDASGRLHFLFSADPAGGAWRWAGAGTTLFQAVLDAEGNPLSLEQLAPALPNVANWMPSLERWDWTSPNPRTDDTVWFMHIRGLNYSTAENGRNKNDKRTEIHLGRLGG